MDKKIRCVECKAEFDFTEGEQEYYHDKQLNQPKRCDACRGRRKAEKERIEKQATDLAQGKI